MPADSSSVVASSSSSAMEIDGETTNPALLIDSLAYVDDKYYSDSLIKHRVKQLIESEMNSMPKKDYIAHLPPTPTLQFEKNPFLQTLLERIKKGEHKTGTPMFDTSRYELAKPEKVEDVEEWKLALNNAQAQVEHMNNKLLNLQLMSKYGANAWLVANSKFDVIPKHLQKSLDKIKEQKESVNRKRKFEQTDAGKKLEIYENQYRDLIARKFDLLNENAVLERQIKRLRTEAKRKGLIQESSNAESSSVATDQS